MWRVEGELTIVLLVRAIFSAVGGYHSFRLPTRCEHAGGGGGEVMRTSWIVKSLDFSVWLEWLGIGLSQRGQMEPAKPRPSFHMPAKLPGLSSALRPLHHHL